MAGSRHCWVPGYNTANPLILLLATGISTSHFANEETRAPSVPGHRTFKEEGQDRNVKESNSTMTDISTTLELRFERYR